MKQRLALIALLTAIVAGAAYIAAQKSQLPGVLQALAVGDLVRFEVFDKPQPAPATAFQDRAGNSVNLASFPGQVVLANFWATWCVPCLAEMPALNRLQQRLGSDRFKVITISLDRKGFEVIDPFFAKNGIDALEAYLDRSNKLSLEVGATGLPTTVLVSADGRWLARYIGDANWDSAAMAHFLEMAIEGEKEGF